MSDRLSIEELERLAEAIARHLEPFLVGIFQDFEARRQEEMVHEIGSSLRMDITSLADELKEILSGSPDN